MSGFSDPSRPPPFPGAAPLSRRYSDTGSPDTASAPPYQKEEEFLTSGSVAIPYVTPITTHYHVSILRHFCALYNAVEAKDAENTGPVKLVQQFLVCAEARYVMYLDLLEQFFSKPGHRSEKQAMSEVMPLPPWDVAIIFHVHCLSPFRFYTDMQRRKRGPILWDGGLSFPLTRLHDLISKGIWTDNESESAWEAFFPQFPYQLWNAHPETGAHLYLQDVQFHCPWGNQVALISLEQFAKTQVTKSSTFTCPSCGRLHDAETVSSKHLFEDFKKVTPSDINNMDAWLVKGAVSGSLDSTPNLVANDFWMIFNSTLTSGGPRSQPQRTHLARYIASAQEPSWNTFIRSFAETVKELKAAGKFRELSRGKLLVSIRTAYMGIMWPQLSIDLVAAALRQREFATKITSPSCAGLDTSSALYHSNTRYHKFLLLMKRSTKTSLVPTLDIDLSWHTHQLHPIAYRDWCVQNLGVAVNHDDTIGEGDLAKGLRQTSLAWHDAYKEGYTTDNVRKSYWSPGRVAAGVLFPPYGLYMLNKGNKLPKGPPPAAARGPSGTTNRDTSGFGYGNYYPYMFLFPYGLAFPIGYYYAAGCAPGAVCIGSMVPSAGACGSCMDGSAGGGCSTAANCGGGGGCGSCGGGGMGGSCGGAS